MVRLKFGLQKTLYSYWMVFVDILNFSPKFAFELINLLKLTLEAIYFQLVQQHKIFARKCTWVELPIHVRFIDRN